MRAPRAPDTEGLREGFSKEPTRGKQNGGSSKNKKQNYRMNRQSHFWMFTPKKPETLI